MTAIRGSRSFSLIELVIVVVVIGIIAAIAIPRMSHGARNAGANALKANLSAFRTAFERYKAEHGGKSPLLNPAQKLTQFSNLAGTATSPTSDPANGIVYGPYLRKISPLPVGSRKGATGIYHFNGSGGVPQGGVPSDGWWYSHVADEIRANLPATEKDDQGVPYNTY